MICKFDFKKINSMYAEIKITGKSFVKKKITPLTKKKLKLCDSQENCYICKKNKQTEDKYGNDKKYRKVGDHCHYIGKYRCVVHSICNLRYSIPKESSVIFNNE